MEQRCPGLVTMKQAVLFRKKEPKNSYPLWSNASHRIKFFVSFLKKNASFVGEPTRC
jgi:hypothetical protein